MLLLAIISTPALIFAMVLDYAIHNPTRSTDIHPVTFYGREYIEY